MGIQVAEVFSGYFVATDGTVYSTVKGKWKQLSPAKNKDGYLQVSLRVEGGMKNYRVHRLVAKAFLRQVEGKDVVNHKNGIKTDNRLDNLEWCTNQENVDHAWRTGLSKGNEYSNWKENWHKGLCTREELKI